MRATAPLPQSFIESKVRPEASDRHVRVNVFAPYPTFTPVAITQGRMASTTAWLRDWTLSSFGQPSVGMSHGGIGLRPAASSSRSPADWIVAGVSPNTLKALREAKDPRAVGGAVAAIARNVQALRSPGVVVQTGKQSRLIAVAAELEIQRALELIEFIGRGLRLLEEVPVGAPEGSSELGFLYLDRTRIRPVGADIGELFDSVPLIPGQEALFEVRTTLRQSVSVEDSIEREYEAVLEQNSQSSETTATTLGDQTTQSSGLTTGTNATIGLPAESVPVDASLGVNASNTFSRSAASSTQRSLTIATTVSNRVTSKLRQNHKAVVKRETESAIDRLTRNSIRNPNAERPITLHYYKLLQRLELQQERTGVRLCWAPFIVDPGAALRFRAMTARAEVLEAAERRVRLPLPPRPPKPEFQAFWATGEKLPIQLGGGLVHFYTEAPVPLRVAVGDDDTPTGRYRIDVTGRDKDAVLIKHFSDPIGPDADGVISSVATFAVGLHTELSFELALSAEVLRQLPSYATEMEAYHLALKEHEHEVSRLLTVARDESRGAAESALHATIARTDPRDEILGAVFQQYVLPYFPTPGLIEHWHRLVDVDHVGYVTYPGWWRRGPLPLPEYGPRHFVNASVARAFLPFRRGMEEEALYQLFDAGQLSGRSIARFNALVKKIVDALGDPDAGDATMPLGAPWYESVPVPGAHVEVEFSAAEALDATTLTQVRTTVARIEEEVAALQAENRIRAGTTPVSTSTLAVGPLR